MNFQTIKFTINHNIARLNINRPHVKNALCMAFFTEFQEIIQQISNNAEIEILIISGEGDSFAAGADLSEVINMKEEEAYLNSLHVQNSFNKLAHLEIPVISVINGFCMGGGLELAMACDIRIASDSALFAMPETKIGICPGGAGTQRLAKIAGTENAMFYLLSGETFSADEAARMGIVSKVFPQEELNTGTEKLIKGILRNSSEASKTIKHLIQISENTDFNFACEQEAKSFAKLITTSGQEGMQAFLEKRAPNWKKKKE